MNAYTIVSTCDAGEKCNDPIPRIAAQFGKRKAAVLSAAPTQHHSLAAFQNVLTLIRKHAMRDFRNGWPPIKVRIRKDRGLRCHSTRLTRSYSVHYACYTCASNDVSAQHTGLYRSIELSLIHISEPTRQAEISYAVFCLKK